MYKVDIRNICTKSNKDPWGIIDAISNAGGKIRFVGGCVRDILLNTSIQDFDFATDLEPQDVMKQLEKYKIKYKPSGIAHGTVMAIYKGTAYEITTLRSDVMCDGRRAIIKFTKNWAEDAARRDFTFNAISCDLDGNLYDYFNGINDLKNKRLRFIGDAHQRVTEDYLRILRAFRFFGSVCYEKNFPSDIFEVCKCYAKKIDNLSRERIRSEFIKILHLKNFMKVIRYMNDALILKYVLHSDVNQNFLQLDISKFNINYICIITLMTVNHSVLPSALCLTKYEKKYINCLLDFKFDLTDIYNNYFIAKKMGKDFFWNMMVINKIKNQIDDKFFRKLNNILKNINFNFPITGADLTAIIKNDGKVIGKMLHDLERYWVNGGYCATKQELLAHARSKF